MIIKTIFQVILDFENQSPYRPSSFYTAITRVHRGQDLYLRGFDPKFIINNQEAEREITRLRNTRPFSKTKVYLDEEIYQDSSELKVGFLNVNGLLNALHCDLLNSDKNLASLDILCLGRY